MVDNLDPSMFQNLITWSSPALYERITLVKKLVGLLVLGLIGIGCLPSDDGMMVMDCQ
jgi:hypothetical protein